MMKTFSGYIMFPVLLLFGCKENGRTSNNKAEVDSVSASAALTIRPENNDTTMGTNDAASVPGFKSFVRYNLEDTIEEDLNGDGIKEKAFIQQEKEQSHIYITDGSTHQTTKLGKDSSFRYMGDDFGWIDSWGVTRDSITFEILVVDGELTGEKEKRLYHPSIVVRKEGSGGVITWGKDAYKWVHQSD